ncbi:uncharacterized protein BXZ73DRAFT_31926, partial [Epithele typhae]|uniref:uncharacterized protein n=1 Tax=Epithele typhae TaxID=378194 RepID=UPI002007B199
LYEDLRHEKLELRTPAEVLPRILGTSHVHNTELPIRIDVNARWWFQLLWWIVVSELTSIDPDQYLCLYAHDKHVGATNHLLSLGDRTHSPSLDHALGFDVPSLLFFRAVLDPSTPSISLDCIPHHRLEDLIRKLQASLKSGQSVALGLTARSPASQKSFWTDSTILTAIPFLPRSRLEGCQRTTTPLFASVHAILRLLTTGPTPLTIDIARNVSSEYSDFLRDHTDQLENDPELRQRIVEGLGRQAWVEERLCASWEAALVDLGFLESWVII